MSQYSAENSKDSAKSNTRLIPLVEIGLPRQGSIYTNAGGVAIPPPQLKQHRTISRKNKNIMVYGNSYPNKIAERYQLLNKSEVVSH